MPTQPKKEKKNLESVFKKILKLKYQELLTAIANGEVGASSILPDINRDPSGFFIVGEKDKKSIRHIRYDDFKTEYKEELLKLLSLLNMHGKSIDRDKIEALSTLINNIEDGTNTNPDNLILSINKKMKDLSNLSNNEEIDEKINLIEKFFDFKDITQLSQFIRDNLFNGTENKNNLLTLFLYAYHQGGFPNIDASVITEISSYFNLDSNGSLKEAAVLFTQASTHTVDLIALTEGTQQIRQLTMYTSAKNCEGKQLSPEQPNEYHLKIESTITLRITEKALVFTLDEVKVDCASKLAQKEFSKSRLQEFFAVNNPFNRNWCYLFLDLIKACLKKLLNKMDKLKVELPENWQEKAEKNGEFKKHFGSDEGNGSMVVLTSRQQIMGGNKPVNRTAGPLGGYKNSLIKEITSQCQVPSTSSKSNDNLNHRNPAVR